METDYNGPLQLRLPQCLKKNSVVAPKVASHVIAVVGPTNPVQEAVTNYLKKLFEY